jgi:hypothetical protein
MGPVSSIFSNYNYTTVFKVISLVYRSVRARKLADSRNILMSPKVGLNFLPAVSCTRAMFFFPPLSSCWRFVQLMLKN